MPSPNAYADVRAGARTAGLIAVAVVALSPVRALADTKQECSDSYYRTQVLRDADKLQEGIREARVCAREACPQFIREDCSRWMADLEARVSTIIVAAVDASGRSVSDAIVSLDGVPWLDRLGRDAQVISKGPHTLEITVQGAPPQKKAIVVREGEKNRTITIAIAGAEATDEPWEGHAYGPWIVGGIGVATLVAGAVTGGLVLDAYAVTEDQCDDATRTCTPDGVEAQDRGRLLGPATTTLLVAGGALAAGGIIWLIAAPRAPSPSRAALFAAPAISTESAGVVVGGRW